LWAPDRLKAGLHTREHCATEQVLSYSQRNNEQDRWIGSLSTAAVPLAVGDAAPENAEPAVELKQ